MEHKNTQTLLYKAKKRTYASLAFIAAISIFSGNISFAKAEGTNLNTRPENISALDWETVTGSVNELTNSLWSNSNDVGIGIGTAMEPHLHLKVGGDALVTDSMTAAELIADDKMRSDQYCDANGENCFIPTETSICTDNSSLTSCTIEMTENAWVAGTDPNEIHYSQANVGIGISNPETPLHIGGDVTLEGDLLFNKATGNFRIIDTPATTGSFSWGDNTQNFMELNDGGDLSVRGNVQADGNILVNESIGIGIENPFRKLHIAFDIPNTHPDHSAGQLRVENLNTTGDFPGAAIEVKTNGSNDGAASLKLMGSGGEDDMAQVVYYPHEKRMGIGPNTNRSLHILGDSGNVGIGIQDPQRKLHIVFNGHEFGESGQLRVENLKQTGDGSNASLNLKVNNPSASSGIQFNGPDESAIFGFNHGTDGFYFIEDGETWADFIGGKFILRKGGHIALNPIDGGIEIGSGNDNISYIDFKGNNNITSDFKGRISYTDNEAEGYGMIFVTKASQRMIIDNTGQVGIGTMDPTGKFSVQDGNWQMNFSKDFDTDIDHFINSAGQTIPQGGLEIVGGGEPAPVLRLRNTNQNGATGVIFDNASTGGFIGATGEKMKIGFFKDFEIKPQKYTSQLQTDSNILIEAGETPDNKIDINAHYGSVNIRAGDDAIAGQKSNQLVSSFGINLAELPEYDASTPANTTLVENLGGLRIHTHSDKTEKMPALVLVNSGLNDPAEQVGSTVLFQHGNEHTIQGDVGFLSGKSATGTNLPYGPHFMHLQALQGDLLLQATREHTDGSIKNSIKLNDQNGNMAIIPNEGKSLWIGNNGGSATINNGRINVTDDACIAGGGACLSDVAIVSSLLGVSTGGSTSGGGDEGGNGEGSTDVNNTTFVTNITVQGEDTTNNYALTVEGDTHIQEDLKVEGSTFLKNATVQGNATIEGHLDMKNHNINNVNSLNSSQVCLEDGCKSRWGEVEGSGGTAGIMGSIYEATGKLSCNGTEDYTIREYVSCDPGDVMVSCVWNPVAGNDYFVDSWYRNGTSSGGDTAVTAGIDTSKNECKIGFTNPRNNPLFCTSQGGIDIRAKCLKLSQPSELNGDNLGNHTAVRDIDLNQNQYSIINAKDFIGNGKVQGDQLCIGEDCVSSWAEVGGTGTGTASVSGEIIEEFGEVPNCDNNSSATHKGEVSCPDGTELISCTWDHGYNGNTNDYYMHSWLFKGPSTTLASAAVTAVEEGNKCVIGVSNPNGLEGNGGFCPVRIKAKCLKLSDSTAGAGTGGASLWGSDGAGNLFHTGGKVGIGTDTPSQLLEVSAEGRHSVINNFTYSDKFSDYGVFVGGHFGGTEDNKTITKDGFLLSGLEAKGYAGKTLDSQGEIIDKNHLGGVIRIEAAGDWNIQDGTENLGTVTKFYNVRQGEKLNSLNMIIDEKGQVGIGTNDPTAKLDVAGNIFVGIDPNAPVAPGSYNPGGMIKLAGRGSGDDDVRIQNASGNLYTANNVGIGTPTPGAKLDVNGDIKVGTTSATCDATKAGAMRYEANIMEYCNGTAWTALAWDHIATENIQLSNFWLSNDGGDEGIMIDNDGKVLIQSSGTFSEVATVSYTEDAADGSFFAGGRARVLADGSLSNILDGDMITSFSSSAYNNAFFHRVGEIKSSIQGTPGTGVPPSNWTFSTADGSNNPPAERLRITPDGKVGIGETAPKATLDINGGIALNVTEQTANYTATPDDYMILCNDPTEDGTNIEITLPVAADAEGQELTIKKIDATADACTINGNGANIDGNGSIDITSQYQAYTVISDGTQWWIK